MGKFQKSKEGYRKEKGYVFYICILNYLIKFHVPFNLYPAFPKPVFPAVCFLVFIFVWRLFFFFLDRTCKYSLHLQPRSGFIVFCEDQFLKNQWRRDRIFFFFECKKRIMVCFQTTTSMEKHKRLLQRCMRITDTAVVIRMIQKFCAQSYFLPR